MKKTDHVRVGLFVLGSLALFVVLVVVAIGSRIGTRETTYFIHFRETVKGMVVGSPVNFQGVRIGTVRDMRFVSGMTEVSIAIDPEKAPIQSKTVASLDRAWVTGQVTVELQGWTKNGEPLPEYGVIHAELSPAARVMRSMPEVFTRATDILEEFAGVAKGFTTFLKDGSPLLEESIGLLRELRRTNAFVHEHTLPRVSRAMVSVTELAPSIERTLSSFDRLTTRVDTLASNPAIRAAVEETATLMAAARKTLPEFLRLSREFEVFFRGNRVQLREALTNFAGSMRELQAFAALMQQAPNALLFGYRMTTEQSVMTSGSESQRSAPPTPSGGRE